MFLPGALSDHSFWVMKNKKSGNFIKRNPQSEWMKEDNPKGPRHSEFSPSGGWWKEMGEIWIMKRKGYHIRTRWWRKRVTFFFSFILYFPWSFRPHVINGGLTGMAVYYRSSSFHGFTRSGYNEKKREEWMSPSARETSIYYSKRTRRLVSCIWTWNDGLEFRVKGWMRYLFSHNEHEDDNHEEVS